MRFDLRHTATPLSAAERGRNVGTDELGRLACGTIF
jgi:hypothetical protein